MIAKTDSRASVQLDLIRGLAAVAVFVGHARAMFFVDFSDISFSATPFIKLLYLTTGFGHQAVMVFFVLSGYFITSSILRSWDRWSWAHYLCERFVRLYLVLLPGLLLTAFMDWVGYHLGNPDIYEGRLPGTLISYRVIERSDVHTFLINLAFLQTVLGPPFGSNSPLWSLCYEFWYYMAFPCLLVAADGKRRWRQRILHLGMAVGIAWLVGTQVALYFSIWLMGALIRFCPPLLRSDASALRKTLQLMTFTTTIAIVLGSRIWANEPGWDFAIGGSFAAWVYLKLHDDSRARAGAITWIARLLAGCSFTLYVIHFPVLVMIDSFVVGSGRWQPTSLRMTWLLLITFGIFLFAVGWAMLTEANTSVVRRWLRLNSDRRPDQAN